VRTNILPYLLLLPATIVMLMLGYYPLPQAFWYSLLWFRPSNPTMTHFIGLDNYVYAFFADSRFWISIWNTGYFSVLSVVGSILGGLGVALLLNEKFRGRGILRTLSLLPWLMPPVVNGLIWKWIFDDRFGAFNAVLYGLHLIPAYQPWLTFGSSFGMSVAALVFVWRNIPFVAIILLAGLQSIPTTIYESAKIDGASMLQRFYRMTLPFLSPAIAITLVQMVVSAVNTYDILYVLLGFQVPNLPLYTYLEVFSYGDFGYGSALAWILTIISLIIGYSYVRVLYKEGFR